MSNVVINDNHLKDIANAIRSKNGTDIKYKPKEMADAIVNITTGTEEVQVEQWYIKEVETWL